MRVELNGKLVEGEGTADEPPTSFHVFKRLLGQEVKRVGILPGEGDRGEVLFLTLGPHRLSVRVRLEQAAEGSCVDLWVQVGPDADEQIRKENT